LSLGGDYVRNEKKPERAGIRRKQPESLGILAEYSSQAKSGFSKRVRFPILTVPKTNASKTTNKINGFKVLELSNGKTGQNHRRSRGVERGTWLYTGQAPPCGIFGQLLKND
jgi:hypothetical protein